MSLMLFAALPPASAQETVNPQVALLIDASGSMNADDVEGGTRMDAAKEAATEVVGSLSDGTDFALLAYGSEVPESTGDIEAGCQDVSVLQPLGAPDTAGAQAAIEGIEATGFTSIGQALRTAGEQFSGEGERSIILVSDGIDTCAPPPVCDVAEELADDGIGVTIHTVGFRVDEAARAELECIADVSGGSYSQADDTEQLAEQLNAVAQVAATAYEASGTEFEYGDVYLGEGTYVSQLPGPIEVPGRSGPNDPGETRTFRLAVPEGETAHVVANLVPPLEPDVPQYFGLNIEATNSTCNASPSGYESFQPGHEAPSAVHIRILSDEDCDPTEWTVHTHRSGTADTQDRQVEYVIGFEPPVELADFGPEDNMNHVADNGDGPDLEKNLAVSPATPGRSYASALPVEPGAYSAAIVPGETHFYRLPVEWGQRLVAEATFEPLDGASVGGHMVQVDIAPPTRQSVLGPLFDSLQTDESVTYTNTSSSWSFYRNQDGPVSNYLKDQAYAGDWYATVSYNGNDANGRPSTPVGYELKLVADGAVAEGPDWRLPTEPGPEASAEPLTATTSSEVATSTSASASASAEQVEAQDAASGSSEGMSPLVIGVVAVIAVLLLVIVGLMIFLAARRR